MFEKESKEYANKWLEHVKDLELQHKSDEKPEYIRILEAHQKGAEFGYNKANEWHYVKDGNPNNDNDILCQISKDEVVVGYYHTVAKQYITIDGQDLYNVIAWKEIVLPELLKESL